MSMTCGCPDCEADRLQKPCPYREQVAAWMRKNGFATGHGDTVESLLAELTWQIEELREQKKPRLSPDAYEENLLQHGVIR
jgi:hypothetical protein